MLESILMTTGLLVLICLMVCCAVQSQRISLRPRSEVYESWRSAAANKGLTIEQWLLSQVGVHSKEKADD